MLYNVHTCISTSDDVIFTCMVLMFIVPCLLLVFAVIQTKTFQRFSVCYGINGHLFTVVSRSNVDVVCDWL